jgi:radical SAM superfamily enzyme YgiQ (UPF0313 family)
MDGILFNVTEKVFQNRSAGIYRIAHFLRENGLDVEVVDWANHWQLDELKELFKSRYNIKLKFVGFSHMFSMWDPVLDDLCAWIKKSHPEIKIISGSSSKPWFRTQYIDFYVSGFGEYAALELVKYICSNGPSPRFSLEMTNGRPLIDANASYTAYPMKSLMIKYEDRDYIKSHEWLGIETARGCMFQCDFCNFPVLGVKGDYTRDAKDFELHLRDAYDRFGVTGFVVADETFNDRTDKITKFADAVESLPFSPYFTGFLRADLIHSRPKDLTELARMNFIGHYYGIESFHRPSAKSIGKGLDPEKIKKSLVNTKDYFKKINKPYRGTISLILGLPYETIESLEQTKQWLIDNWQGNDFIVFVLTIPNSPDSRDSLISKDYKKYGYRELSSEEIEKHLKLKSMDSPRVAAEGTDLFWINEHMDIFKAREILDEFISLRKIYDFRAGSFPLGFKSNIKSLEGRLNSSYREFGNSLESDIKWYIDSKLNR